MMVFKMLIVHLSIFSGPPHVFVVVTFLTITLVESQDSVIFQYSCEELCDVQRHALDFFEAECSGYGYDSIADISSCTDVNKITLRNNDFRRLHNISLPSFSMVTELDISENYITEIDAGAFRCFPNVNLLSLLALRVHRLVNNAFEGLPMLKKLYIFSGRIQSIDVLALAGLAKLTTLNLSYNKIASLPAGLFRDTPKLESLILSYNRLNDLPENIFSYLPKLRILKLDRNNIVSIPVGLASLDNLFEVNLNHNILSEIPHLKVTNLFVSSNQITTLNVPANTSWHLLHLHDNPLHCDHELEPLRRWMAEDRERVGPSLICSTPPGRAEKMLEDLAPLIPTPMPTTPQITTESETTYRDPVNRESTQFNPIIKGFTRENNRRSSDWGSGSSNLAGLSVMTLVLLSAAASLIT